MKAGTISYDVTFHRKSGKVRDMPVEVTMRNYAIGIAYHEESKLDGEFSSDDLDRGLIGRLEQECVKAMVRDPTLRKYSARAVQNLPLKEPEMNDDENADDKSKE